MRLLPFVVLLAAPAAFAGVIDLRGVDIGTPCQSVPPSEVALGAQPKFAADLMLQKGLLLFRDDSLAGQTTVILYGCAGSPATVSNYAITVSTADQARASSLYTKARNVVAARLGPAAFDSGKLKTGDRKVFLSVAGGPQALATWQNVAGFTVHVSLLSSQSTGLWSVVTSVAEPQQNGVQAN